MFVSIFFAAFLFILTSCGGGGTPEEKVISVKDVEISGELVDYIKVVDSDYTLKYKNGSFKEPQIAIKLELVEKYNEANINMIRYFNLTLLDESNTNIMTLKANSENKVIDLLKGEIGKQTTITFGGSQGIVESEVKSAMTESASIELSSKFFEKKESLDDFASSSSSSGNSNFDVWLKDYERFIDQYIRLYKKAQSGDMSALSEYAGLSKAQNIGTKLGNADLTHEQLERFTKLQMKFANAAME